MTLEACLAYANFWYAQAQVQALVRQGQYPMSPLSTVAQPRAQPSRFGMSSPGSTRRSRMTTKKCPAINSFIQELVVCHNFVFGMDRLGMLKGFVRC